MTPKMVQAARSRLTVRLLTAATAAVVALVAAPAASAVDSIYWTNFGTDKVSFTALDATVAGDLNTTGATLADPFGTAIDAAAGRIYWANQTAGKISFANLNGTGGGDLNTTGATVAFPAGVAVDPAAGRIYWASATAAKISFANLSGTGGGDLTTTGATVSFPAGVAVDSAAGRIYWANNSIGGPISSASTAGGSGSNLTTTGADLGNPIGLAIDPAGGRIYWATNAGNKISNASLSGSGGFDLPTLTATVSGPAFPSILKSPTGTGGPIITGGSTLGSTLSCSQGTWAPDLLSSFLYRAPASFAYQWSRDGTPISGATENAVAANTPGSYTCRVTATNHAGSSSQTSAAAGVNPADNSFQLGATKLNKKKGTASISVTLPGPGTLALSGKNVAANSQEVTGGSAKLTVKAKGKAAKTLKKKGKVTVKAKITFTPTAGDPSSQDRSVKLRKKK